jgi:hypothetical protein
MYFTRGWFHCGGGPLPQLAACAAAVIPSTPAQTAAATKKPDWILRIELNPLTPVNHNLPDLEPAFNRLRAGGPAKRMT